MRSNNPGNASIKRHRLRTACLFCLMLFMTLITGCNNEHRAAKIEKLRQERQELLSRVEALQEEQRFLMFEKEISATNKRYLVLDTRTGTGSLRLGSRVLREFKLVLDECARPENEPSEDAASFVLPKGVIQVLAKKELPVWYKPDWLYEKEGKAPSPLNSAERLIKGPLGEYALFFGGGFVIHGRPVKGAPRVPLQHACIILADDDLRVLYDLLGKGSAAYVR